MNEFLLLIGLTMMPAPTYANSGFVCYPDGEVTVLEQSFIDGAAKGMTPAQVVQMISDRCANEIEEL